MVWIHGFGTGDNKEIFSVASMKKMLIQVETRNYNNIIEWNSWIPQKINIFGWKLLQDRLPTKDNLAKRNIQMDLNTCYLCNSENETADHLFTSCFTTAIISQSISGCCKIPPIYAFSVHDLFEVHRYVNNNDKRKRLIQSIILTACWTIWFARNKVCFENESVKINKIIGDIKSLSFL
ncbi:putative reverse transcriptase zinc-binding domain-containing protein [Helianthus annuus]|nr:putative reverse transcriptase zinc-binding domain-containing protein [Helianthus annuus]